MSPFRKASPVISKLNYPTRPQAKHIQINAVLSCDSNSGNVCMSCFSLYALRLSAKKLANEDGQTNSGITNLMQLSTSKAKFLADVDILIISNSKFR